MVGRIYGAGREDLRSARVGRWPIGNGVEADNAAARRVVIKTGVSVGGMVYVYCDGRGNLRVAKTPPLQSALRGDRWGDYRATIIYAPWASMGNGVEANNNAARRGVIKTRGSHRWEA